MCPAAVTDAVLDKLRSESGAVHLIIARGAAVDPPGDLVQADVVREAADGLLADLCELGIDHVGGITLQPLDTVLSDAAALAAPGEPATRWCGRSSSPEPGTIRGSPSPSWRSSPWPA